MIFAAKCYWPGITREELGRAGGRATEAAEHATRQGTALSYLGSILFPDDELVLCLFDGASPTAVKRANDRAGLPCERIMHSIWLAPKKPSEHIDISNRGAGESPPGAPTHSGNSADQRSTDLPKTERRRL
jgi:hypothetical protein